MGQIDLLYRLQQIDDEITEKKTRFGELLRLQKESAALISARERAQAAAAKLQKRLVHQKDLNLELSGLADKVKRSEDRLYSGLVKNPKELSDLQHEIDSLSRRRALLEDEVLEAMILVEEAQEENDKAASAHQDIESAWSASQVGYKGEQNELVQRINELNGIRKQQADSVTPRFLTAYENLRKKGVSTAVVPLRNNRCRGCQVTVPANLAKAANEGLLAYCESCGRILIPA